MKERLEGLEQEMRESLEAASSADALEQFRVKYLGRKGALTEVLRGLGSVSPEERPRVGQAANVLKKKFEAAVDEKSRGIGTVKKDKGPKADLSLPGPKFARGAEHPVSKVMNQVNDIFLGLGFRIAEGPEIETGYYNFTALNIPDDHPSQESFHTYFIDVPKIKHPGTKKDYAVLLRSQTSTVQIRIMEKVNPPLQVLMPGKVYRPDATDASHSFMFHQTEGLMVDKDIRFSDLKGVLDLFCKQPRPEDLQGFRLVLVLGFLVLAAYHDSRGDMSDPDSGISRINVLPPRTGGAKNVDP